MAASDDLIKAVGANIQEKASLIWSAADTLRGPYKPHEYGLVILPMTVIKRFHDCLVPTHDAVLAAAEKYRAFSVKDGFLREASGYPLLQHLEVYLRDAQGRSGEHRGQLQGLHQRVLG